MTPFEKSSYLTQVRRLRTLTIEVLKHYPIKVRTIELIKHSANTTFRVTDTKAKRYLLRIHPDGYHTKPAILEEINWLHHILTTMDLLVPKPINTYDGQYVISCQHPSISAARFCDMFEWIPGKIRWKSIDKQYAFNLGSVIARLQKNGRDITIKYRHYWSADGLVGTDKAKFYNVEKLTDVSKQEQTIITQARRFSYQILKQYEKTNKDKIGLIHADMQPNNFIFYNDKYAVIDFDDCGIGLYGDDLAVALFAFEYLTEGKSKKDFFELKEALFKGYAEHMPFTQKDINLSPVFLLARKLTVIGWLELRKDNPRLKAYFREAIARAIKFFKSLDKNKPQLFLEL